MRNLRLIRSIIALLLGWLVVASAQEAGAAKGDAKAKAPAPGAKPGKDALAAKTPAAGKDWTVPDLGLEFVWVEALKLHVGKYEVTNAEYRKKEPKHDSREFADHSLNGERQPVVLVNFEDATAYAAWLTERERAAGRLPAGWQYRLPTGTEWLAFAKCGDERRYPWGDDWPPKYGNYHDQGGAGTWGKIQDYDDGFPVSCDVEKSGKNDWGLFGVGGNVWECTGNEAGGFDAWRGSSWSYDFTDFQRCAGRDGTEGACRDHCGGFRLVLSR